MKVCTWNIWAKGGSALKPRHWIEAARYLQAHTLDLVALQEVDRGWSERTEGSDVAADMAMILGFESFFSASITRPDGGQYGNAVLSRFPILDSGSVALESGREWDPADHETEPRSAAWVRVERPEPTVFISTHLACAPRLRSTPITRRQAGALHELVLFLRELYPRHVVILAGDFNLEAESEELVEIETTLRRQGERLPTWPVHPFLFRDWEEEPPPRWAIDHIFSSVPMSTWTGASSLSDHLPLFARTLDGSFWAGKGQIQIAAEVSRQAPVPLIAA